MPDKMKELIAEQLCVDASEIDLTSNFKEDLEADSVKKFAEINSSDEYSMTVNDDIELEIGDIVGGRDYITGITIAMPVTKKIIKYSNKKRSVSYGIGGRK